MTNQPIARDFTGTVQKHSKKLRSGNITLLHAPQISKLWEGKIKVEGVECLVEYFPSDAYESVKYFQGRVKKIHEKGATGLRLPGPGHRLVSKSRRSNSMETPALPSLAMTEELNAT